MAELEQLAGRIVMLHRGNIAFDGDFETLRRDTAARRVLLLQTTAAEAPRLEGALHRESEACRHSYIYDSARASMASLLAQAEAQAEVVDVETHRPAIDEVVADLYERWLAGGSRAPTSPPSP